MSSVLSVPRPQAAASHQVPVKTKRKRSLSPASDVSSTLDRSIKREDDSDHELDLSDERFWVQGDPVYDQKMEEDPRDSLDLNDIPEYPPFAEELATLDVFGRSLRVPPEYRRSVSTPPSPVSPPNDQSLAEWLEALDSSVSVSGIGSDRESDEPVPEDGNVNNAPDGSNSANASGSTADIANRANGGGITRNTNHRLNRRVLGSRDNNANMENEVEKNKQGNGGRNELTRLSGVLKYPNRGGSDRLPRIRSPPRISFVDLQLTRNGALWEQTGWQHGVAALQVMEMGNFSEERLEQRWKMIQRIVQNWRDDGHSMGELLPE